MIRTESLSELLDVASLLANQPLPAGPRVGIITNAGGPAIMCADACEAVGLEVPAVPAEVRASMAEGLSREASLANPVDMIATASAEQYRSTITTLGEWKGIDALIVIFIRPLLTRAEDVAEAVRAACSELTRPIPVLGAFMSTHDHEAMAGKGGSLVPVSRGCRPQPGSGDAPRRVAGAAHEEPAGFADAEEDRAAEAIARGLARGGGWLGIEEVTELLTCYGIAMPEWRLVDDSVAAGHAAEEMGGRVALKAVGPAIVHKTDLHAVRIGLAGAADVSWAAVHMDEASAPPASSAASSSRRWSRAGPSS